MPSATVDPARLRMGRAIRSRRQTLGLDIRTAAASALSAKGVGMSAATWGRIENGYVEAHPSTVARIEDVLKVVRGSAKAVYDGRADDLAPIDGPPPARPVVTTDISNRLSEADLATPGGRRRILISAFDEVDDATQRQMAEVALAAHRRAHGLSQTDDRPLR